MNIPFIKRYLLLIGVIWSLACAATLVSHLRDDYQQAVKRAQTRATTMLERDILYRDWVASHGGVYAPVSAALPPNPHLEFLPDRDLETVDGRHLTLVNPSYMTRLAFEQDNRLGGTISKITSLKFLNPDNAPDPWERTALLQLAEGSEMVSEIVNTGSQSYVRVLRPFHVEAVCLKCHADQGYSLGDIRGGLSISIPFESFFSGHWQHNVLTVALFASLWLVGLIGVCLLGRKLYAQTGKAIESERQRDHAEMSLNFLSNFDRRTNLPNRFKFEAQLHELFTLLEDSGDLVAVIVLEIRNFKQIVDNFDYHVGDVLFKIMAERIANLLSPGDSVARFGEDRLLLSQRCRHEQSFMQKLLPQLNAELSKPVKFEGHDFFPVLCMGVAFYPTDAADARRLVQRALSAVTCPFENKQNGVKLYSQALQDEARERLEIEGGLRGALAENGFELFLQPQVDATSGSLIGAEALLRWNRQGRGYLSPDQFIPIAEENGLILPIGEWVLQTACLQAVTLRKRFGKIIPIGVNVSARQFQDQDFVDIIDEVLAIDGDAA